MDLERKLNSVGKKAFIENYEIFRSYAYGRITKINATKRLMDIGVSNEAGASIRLGNAKAIFDNRMVKEALCLVLNAKNISLEVKKKAIKILEENIQCQS